MGNRKPRHLGESPTRQIANQRIGPSIPTPSQRSTDGCHTANHNDPFPHPHHGRRGHFFSSRKDHESLIEAEAANLFF